MTLRLMIYNIKRGGVGRAPATARVITASAPDVVLLQEATKPAVVEELAKTTGMADWRSFPRQSLGFLARRPVEHASWRRPRLSRHAFVEVAPAGAHIR